MTLTLFYDGYCPLCVAEMRKLKAYDTMNRLRFENIQSEDFTERFPGLDRERLNSRIYGQLEDATLISGLDVTHLAWKLVGKGWVYAPLRWPVIRWLADGVYVLFARYRYQISFLLTGKARCQPCASSQTDGGGQFCEAKRSELSNPKKTKRAKRSKANSVCASSAASDL